MMLYVHIPFCKGKCIYCDFYSAGNPDWEGYIKALLNEISHRKDEFNESLSSIYIGGGTPSLIPERNFREFIAGLRNLIAVPERELHKMQHDFDKFEFTIEVNPEDVTEEKLLCWKECGVNRLSMGVQSLDDTELKFIHRRHSAQKAKESARLARKYFDNLSLDLIYGIPGQTLESLKRSLNGILELNPAHISTYALTYEARTPLSLMLDRGKIDRATDEFYNEMDYLIEKILFDAGYIRYEISNYCKPDFQSRHNSGYWDGTAYVGIGPSAASYNGLDNRRTNPGNLKRYIEFFSDYSPGNGYCKSREFYLEESLGEEERFEEKIFLGIRRREGIDLPSLEKEFGKERLEILLKRAGEWLKTDHLEYADNFLHLTRKGIAISDYITLQLLS